VNGKPRLEQLSRSGEASISFRTTFRNLESERGSGETGQIDISHHSQHREAILYWQSERARQRIKATAISRALLINVFGEDELKPRVEDR
jgi:hypothetical protein